MVLEARVSDDVDAWSSAGFKVCNTLICDYHSLMSLILSLVSCKIKTSESLIYF